MTINDRNWQFLQTATGLSLPFNQAYFKYLRNLGYTGTLQEMIDKSELGLNPVTGKYDLLNGDGRFSASTNWTFTGGASIGSNRLNFTTTGRASHPVSIPATGGIYEVTVTIVSRTAGDVTFNFANNDAGTNASTQVFASRTPGTYVLTVTALAGNTVFRINGVSSYVGSIDTVSVRRA